MSGFTKFVRDNSLSIAFWLLFLACFVGLAFTGFHLLPSDPSRGAHASSVLGYLGSVTFLRGVFSNWQAALLQLLALIMLTVFLRQRGASHSRKLEGSGSDSSEKPDKLVWFGRHRSWLYANSLSLAFLALFLVSFIAYFLADISVANHDRVRAGAQPWDATSFLLSARFWFDTLQTWQAEFFAMGAFLLLSIFLRQEHSAESKPVGSSNADTGETNK